MRRAYPLADKVVQVIAKQKQGTVLDLCCGTGIMGKRLYDLGFYVEAFDMADDPFKFSDVIPFTAGDLSDPLPYPDGRFNYVIFTEVIEHIYNPQFVLQQINRVLSPGGKLIISTPNILNATSRLRFLFEGSFEFYREPPLDYARKIPHGLQNIHVIPWRYQELEYILARTGFKVEDLHTDQVKAKSFILSLLLRPAIFMQNKSKESASKSKNGVEFSRINRILRSSALLAGKHLIIEAVKA
jgi:SAM-dependent methyltransferase